VVNYDHCVEGVKNVDHFDDGGDVMLLSMLAEYELQI